MDGKYKQNKKKIVKERNDYVDYLRGVAILLVVLGHSMTVSACDSQQSVAYNMIWTLQMPLFFMISGYVTKYSSRVDNEYTLKKYLLKRTISYMLPWFSWTMLVKGILLKEYCYLNVRYILWNMDDGYWFLSTIWVITVCFILADYFVNKFVKVKKLINRIFYTVSTCFVEMIFLFLLGSVLGVSFFGIKLILYYMPFYIIGYVYGQVNDIYNEFIIFKNIKNFCICIMFLIWIFLVSRFNFYKLPDQFTIILLRVIASIFGCISFAYLSKSIFKCKRVTVLLKWCGLHSLELYVFHVLVSGMLKPMYNVNFETINGVGLVFANFLLTTLISIITINFLTENIWINKILFAK